ncbi:MAG: uroporphyrinogen decarboxylase family protein [Anaerolineae bacterium]|nr:uroporphyrinogen decarboxylase family protein [Anaerolineae bacterium]
MTPKERVLAALRHSTTDRVPVDIFHGGMYPELELRLKAHFGVLDPEGVRLGLGQDLRWVRPICLSGTGGEWPTESCFGGPYLATYADGVGHRPLRNVSGVAEVERYPWPSADAYDYESVATLAHTYRQYAIVAPGEWAPIFCRISELCGMERAMTMLLHEPAIVEAMVEHITEFYLQFYRRVLDAAPGQIDIAQTGDDLAGQRGLLFSVETFRRYFKKPLGRLFELIKSRGVMAMFHICGAVQDLIPDLIDIGLDILMPLQFRAAGMDARKLKAEYGRHLCFHGGIDVQHTLPHGTPEEVRAEVRERIEVLGRGGGYILASAHGLLDEVPTVNVLAMYDEAQRDSPTGA